MTKDTSPDQNGYQTWLAAAESFAGPIDKCCPLRNALGRHVAQLAEWHGRGVCLVTNHGSSWRVAAPKHGKGVPYGSAT